MENNQIVEIFQVYKRLSNNGLFNDSHQALIFLRKSFYMKLFTRTKGLTKKSTFYIKESEDFEFYLLPRKDLQQTNDPKDLNDLYKLIHKNKIDFKVNEKARFVYEETMFSHIQIFNENEGKYKNLDIKPLPIHNLALKNKLKQYHKDSFLLNCK